MRTEWFGNTAAGEPVEEILLQNASGASMNVLTLGGIVRSLRLPDRSGRVEDVVLGFDRLEPYLAPHPFFGAVAGRVAGRIPGAGFTLEGKKYSLARNDGPHHLHGGICGLDKRLWKAEPFMRGKDEAVRMTYRSPDGEEGYPGMVDFTVTFTLTQENAFLFETEAVSPIRTPVSLTHHSYFNLAGQGTVEGHELTVFSDQVFEVDDQMGPTGRVRSVAGQACDFRAGRRLGDAIPDLFRQHGDLYLLPRNNGLYDAARLRDSRSGHCLTVSTDEACLQVYTGASLDGTLIGKSGTPVPRFGGLCLECEGYPGAVDFPEFGSILLEPGQPRRRTTRYAFSTQ